MRSSISKTFACVSQSFDCSKCFTSSATRAASASTSSTLGGSILYGNHGCSFFHREFTRDAEDFGQQSRNAGRQFHSEISFDRLNSNDKSFRRDRLELLEYHEQIFPIDYAGNGFFDSPLHFRRIWQWRGPAAPAQRRWLRAEVRRSDENESVITRRSIL